MTSENRKYYKYRPLRQDGDAHPFTASIFEKRELWFSSPADFNDPFDCNLRLHVDDSTDDEWIAYIDLMMKESPEDRASLEIVKKGKLWRSSPEMTRGIGDSTQKLNYNDSSVFCLAKTAESIPMFSYYADSHKGVAIEFSFSNRNVPCGLNYLDTIASSGADRSGVVFSDVLYPNEYPELNYHRLYGSDQLLKNIIFTKHYEWRHEREYRIFRRNIRASSVVFDPEILTGVVFGCKAEDSEIELVRGWLAEWPTPVALSRSKVSSKSFTLESEVFDQVGGSSDLRA